MGKNLLMWWFQLDTGGIIFTIKTASVGIVKIPQYWTLLRFVWTSAGSCLDGAYARKEVGSYDPRDSFQCDILWLYDIKIDAFKKWKRYKTVDESKSYVTSNAGNHFMDGICVAHHRKIHLVLYEIKVTSRESPVSSLPPGSFLPPKQDTHLDNSLYSTAVVLGNCALL